MNAREPVEISLKSIRAFNFHLFKTLFYFGLLILAFWGLLTFLPYLGKVSFLVILAVFFSTLLGPLVDWMESRGLKRSLAALILLVGFLAVLVIMLVQGIPTLLEEGSRILSTVQKATHGGKINELVDRFNTTIAAYVPGFEIKSSNVSRIVAGFFGQIKTVIAGAVNVVSTFIFILIITFFFLVDGDRITKKILEMVPNRYFEMALNINYQMSLNLTRFIRGQLLAATAIAIESVIGLHILNWGFHANISAPFLIAGIAGIANIIPYVGPVMGTLPAIVVSLYNNIGDPVAAAHWYYIVHIIVMFAIVQFIDNNLVSPLVVSGSMQMHPLTVMLVILIGSQWGVLGMLLAVPAWGVIKVILDEILAGLKRHQVI